MIVIRVNTKGRKSMTVDIIIDEDFMVCADYLMGASKNLPPSAPGKILLS